MRRSQTQCDACPLKARFVTTLTPMIEKVIEAPATYPASEEFAAKANATADLYWEAEVDQLGFWAKQANRLSWQTLQRGAGLVGGAVREVVRRRQAERRL
jgi:hypothetical protein